MWNAECIMLKCETFDKVNVEKSVSFSIHNSAFNIQKFPIFALHL